ncbi:hypothetical protein RHGRI_018067 [Rhododendron griersonianum]|uniref:Uncharacterized protein n=1 Tax=Rhododendron griersonianum TaxID=479676 RepID=A0AAV6K030_9ERIC|nr:hypothetical protein RHGRI_018067 [Rhododendron griersonianum]
MGISRLLALDIDNASTIEAVASSAANFKGVELKAKDIAEAALFLASNESPIYVSGHNLAVDEGFTVVDNSISMIVSQMLMKEKQLEGKVAIITGAASGIGEAAAKVFVENGAFVVVADIQEELGLKVVASIAGPDHRAIYKNCDVTVEKQVEETVAFAIEKYGTLDIMYSNAGIMGPGGSILDMDMEKGFDRTLAVNLRGPALCIKHAARAMVERQVRGSIICTGSVASVLGGMGPHDYTASKHGLLGLVRAAASELGKHGIRVNCVSPFGVATPMAMSGMSVMGINDASKIEAIICSMANLKGIALKAKHVAEAALFLASDESSIYVSGHNLTVDGGFTAVDNSAAMRSQMLMK